MPKTLEEKWEEDVRALIGSLQFNDRITPESKTVFQIDVSGGQDETYIEFDATVSPDPVQKYTQTQKMLERRRKISRFVKNTFKHKYKKFLWVVWIKGTVTDAMRFRAKKSNTILLPKAVYESFNSRVKTLNALANEGREVNVQYEMLRYQLMKIIGAELPEIAANELSHLPAIKFQYGHNTFAYIFALKPDTLIKACYVLKREEVGTPGYQRLLDERRIKVIRDHIEKSKFSFPNNIIINFEDTKIIETSCRESNENGVFDCIISLPNSYCSAQVIDGQHRLYAFDNMQLRLREDLKLDVLAFSRLSEIESGKIFIDLNKEQKRIDPSLYWEIVGDYLKKTPEGAISQVTKSLSQDKGGVFFKKILIPSLPSAEGAEIKLANFCKGIDDRRLMYGVFETNTRKIRSELEHYSWNYFGRSHNDSLKTIKLAKNQLKLFFNLHQEHQFSRYWKAFVMTNTGLNIMLRVLVEVLKYQTALGHTGVPKAEHFKKIFRAMESYVRTYSKERIDQRMRMSSEGARGEWAHEIFEAVHRKIPKFAREYFLQNKIDELSELVDPQKRKTNAKKAAYKSLIILFLGEKDISSARRMARRMNKDFRDRFSKQALDRIKKLE